MIIRLDPTGPPTFSQIRDQIAAMIMSGALAPGSRLPTIRQLAADLDVANNTVGRAYRELEDRGLARARGRRGTVVAEPPSVVQPKPEALRPKAERLALEARHRGISLDAAVEQLRLAFSRLETAERIGR